MIPFSIIAVLALATPASAASDQAARILLEAADRDDRDIDRVARQLAALPSSDLPELFGFLASGQVRDAQASTSAIELDPALRAALLESFGLRSPASVRAFVAGLAPPANKTADEMPDETREAALAVLGEMGRADDVDLILTIASPRSPDASVTRGVRALATDALARTLARDARAIWDLRTAYDRVHPGLVAGIPAAIGLARPPEGLQVLTDLLGEVPELDPIVLAEIGTLAGSVDGQIDPIVLGTVRYHLGHTDPHVVRGAALAVRALDDTRAAEELVQLLRHSDPNVRSSADLALQRIAGRDLRGDASRWESWYAEELAWRDREGPRCLDELTTLDRALVAGALNEIATHRLLRHEFESAVVATLTWKDPGIVGLACGVIAKLGARAALPELRTLRQDPDPALSQAAEGALRTLLGSAFGSTTVAIKR